MNSQGDNNKSKIQNIVSNSKDKARMTSACKLVF